MKRRWEAILAMLGVAAAMVLPSCTATGGDGGMPEETATSIAQSMVQSFVASANGSTAGPRMMDGTPRTVCDRDGCFIRETFDDRLTCPEGGRIYVSGSLTGTIDSRGTGLVLLSVTETISDWKCQPPYVLNGDPYLHMSGQFAFMNGQPAIQQHATVGGGFKWGTSDAESCRIQLDINFNRGGGGRATGTICGRDADWTW